jgi:hypothetical protein
MSQSISQNMVIDKHQPPTVENDDETKNLGEVKSQTPILRVLSEALEPYVGDAASLRDRPACGGGRPVTQDTTLGKGYPLFYMI